MAQVAGYSLQPRCLGDPTGDEEHGGEDVLGHGEEGRDRIFEEAEDAKQAGEYCITLRGQ